MIAEVGDINLRQNLGTLLSQIEDPKDSILISKDGKPVAALSTPSSSPASTAYATVLAIWQTVSLKTTRTPLSKSVWQS